MSETIEQLKEEATELGIGFNPRIGEDKLRAKIEDHYKSQESSGKEIQEAVAKAEAEEESEEKKVAVTGKQTMTMLAKKIFEDAKKTRVVTIIDNDQRVNNQTTTCKANWTNNFYDLGTKTFPLNTPIEIEEGFISVLSEVYIPHHVKDMKTGLSRTTMRRRYTIQEERNLG
jgi:hypothetical protein